VVTVTVPLPEVLLREAFAFTSAGPAALAAFLRAQPPEDPAVTELVAPVLEAASVSIGMSKRSSGGVTLSGPQVQVCCPPARGTGPIASD
jgi:hypothetical protein